jgi:DNA-binding beta-propeller fold protein YncE
MREKLRESECESGPVAAKNRVKMAGGKQMRAWRLGAMGLLLLVVSGCSNNSTPVGVTIIGPGLAPLTVLVSRTAQFNVAVTGTSTSTVFWQICKPPAMPSTTIPPTECIAPQGPVSGCNMPTVAKPISGFGTITFNGLYTAPPTVPNPATFLIVATSCIKSNAFATFTITINSGISVQITPTFASMGPGENFQFTATVSGTANTSVVWLVNSTPGGSAALGYVCPSNAPGNPCTANSAPGQFFSLPAGSPGTVIVTAQSGDDPTHTASAGVSIGASSTPTFSATDPLEPTVAAEGSVQQDVYLSGTDFFSTTHVLVNGVALPTANVTILNGGILARATIPAAQLSAAGDVSVVVQSQSGANSSLPETLHVVPVRPALISSIPNSVPLSGAGVSLSVNLTGGFYVPGSRTTATFDGLGCGGGSQACTTYVDSRHLTVSIQDASLTVPGLYPLVVQNSDAAAANVPSLTGLNLAVTPEPSSISGFPTPTIGVGGGPASVAIDYADALAVVANSTSNNISVVSLAGATKNTVIATIPAGATPTGVAVDDMIAGHLAYVVNSADNSITVIQLSPTPAFVKTVSLNGYEPGIIPLLTVPFSIGANPLTHRAFIANQSTNVGTVLDLANANLAAGCASPPCPIGTVTGGITPYGTGTNPAVAIDPRMNWAMVTPGGSGTIALVDLGQAPSIGDVGRLPELIGSLSITSTMQGIGINTETHQALLADPLQLNLTLFSLLNDAVSPVNFTVAGLPMSTLNLVAAAVNPLENTGIAVQGSSSGATAVVADLGSGIVLKQVQPLGGMPSAVAVDPASNEAMIVNQNDGTVGIVSLGPAPTSPQILEASPATTLTSVGGLLLTLTGANFSAGSVVRLDQQNLGAVTTCPTICRQLTVMIPPGMLEVPRRYLIDVKNTDGSLSNVTDLAVIQAIPVGTNPVGVAVDADRDLAVVTNLLDSTTSLVSLTPNVPGFSPESLGPTGVVGSPISVGTAPQGVAVLPRLGVAMIANNGSNSTTAIDLTTTPPQPIPAVAVCSTCSEPVGVAFNQDTATAAITTTNTGSLFNTGNLNLFSVTRTTTTTPQIAAAFVAAPSTDQNPVAVATDPTLDFAAVATASSTSSLQIIDMLTTGSVGRLSNLQNPSGVVFDPVNQVFLTVNSLTNNILITNPASLSSSSVSVGIAPTSVDYNFQTSSLVTVNSGSHILSVLDYACPPSSGVPSCSAPQVRAVIGLGGGQTSSFVLGPNAVAIDPKLGLAVLVDPDNNRVLLVPLPH